MNKDILGLTRMTDQEFKKLSSLIYNDYGIKMPITKKVMLEGRLRKRLKANNMETFAEYCKYVFSKDGFEREVIHMIDVVSTNKTDFFREPNHFAFITEEFLPKFVEEGSGQLKVWSAASSTGEEAYTIAMVLEEFMNGKRLFNYSIYCTDISTQVLNKGVQGIYDASRIANIPLSLKKKYFLKSKDPAKKAVRVIPELRKKLTFARLNLMDNVYQSPKDFDVIFCRNVLIYFDKATQEKVINKLCDKLKPGGIFILGHSESTTGLNVPLQTVRPTVYKKIKS